MSPAFGILLLFLVLLGGQGEAFGKTSSPKKTGLTSPVVSKRPARWVPQAPKFPSTKQISSTPNRFPRGHVPKPAPQSDSVLKKIKNDAHREQWLFRGAIGLTLLFGFLINGVFTRQSKRRVAAQLEQSRLEGLQTPASLHPSVDQKACIGCGMCVKVCHEKVLALVDHHCHPIAPANCVGCGACEGTCPLGAVQRVFGTKEKGVELPQLDSHFQSTVPGLYIAGELGGMGLIANAIEQAVLAVEHITDDLRTDTKGSLERIYDLAIVGAGPAGFGASLRAHELGLSYVCLEGEEFGGAIRRYSRGKIVMTRPFYVPLYGPVKLWETRKEALIELFSKIIDTTGVRIHCQTHVTNVRRYHSHFEVQSNRGKVLARRVLLAMGQAGSPRKLGVPGENQAFVSYRMTDAALYQHKALVVIGGGDVACETALALSEEPGNKVTLLYRGERLIRPKPANRKRIVKAQQMGQLRVGLRMKIMSIEPGRVLVAEKGRIGKYHVPAQQVFVCAGGVPPTQFLKKLGIAMVVKHGEA